ncbi:Malate dehydrogenase (NADP(+)) [Methanocaldococcus vulcanius M7]|uniref:Malate dehydrogenase (NADP(+)) n=1 Tax=Methanocaldococcus vulcanius (strain ATCC 700851 / DSM 12094 / M7) TaxID=579137 RepID=C9RF74_METVM|nr:L-2-hydroxycarboxylate dehydrogenase [Methanocaldococcus vulcanius]ACX72226.1 Malate dehydrogenase (NADP(+)) [Methanocaldococcus vulcanius M7]
MKVSIIGASGRVGSATALLLAKEPFMKDLVLIGRKKSKNKLEGLKRDIYDALAGSRSDANIFVGTDDDLKIVDESDVVIITSGVPRTEGMSRMDLAKINAKIVGNYAKKISEICDTKLFIITNPVDVMTYKALIDSKYERNNVFGLGTHLDSLRFKVAIAKFFGVHIDEVRTRIIGEHGDSMVPLLSATSIGGIPIQKFEKFKDLPIKEIIEDVKTKGEQIIRLKGGSEFGPAAAILNVVGCIVNNEKRLLTLSAYVNGEFDGIRDVCIGVPVKIGRDGIEEVVSIDLDKDEIEAFRKSAEIIKKYCEEVKFI